MHSNDCTVQENIIRILVIHEGRRSILTLVWTLQHLPVNNVDMSQVKESIANSDSVFCTVVHFLYLEEE